MAGDGMAPRRTVLVLGASGKTGVRVARHLSAAGADVRSASRSSQTVRFDWDDPRTFPAAVDDADGVYLVPPGNSLDFASTVAGFLDHAERAGVAHVTFLSARSVQWAPQPALEAVERDLSSRSAFTHSIVRPAWFMQNFSESFFRPGIVDRQLIVAPTGDGAEPYVDADDVAAVAAATLLDPAGHRDRRYVLTGPAALSLRDVGEVIGTVMGQTVTHVDIAADAWVDGAVDGGLPPDRAAALVSLFNVIRSGQGAGITGDISQVLKRPPIAFAAFARGAGAAWRS